MKSNQLQTLLESSVTFSEEEKAMLRDFAASLPAEKLKAMTAILRDEMIGRETLRNQLDDRLLSILENQNQS